MKQRPIRNSHTILLLFLIISTTTISCFDLKSLFQSRSTPPEEEASPTQTEEETVRPTPNFLEDAELKSKLCKALQIPEEKLDGLERYGLDVSFPIHKAWPSQETQFEVIDESPMRNSQEKYADFFKGCKDAYKSRQSGMECDQNEMERIEMSLFHPPSMKNYTAIGFQKTRAPSSLIKALGEIWEEGKDLKTRERWSPGNTYTNHWASPTYMAPLPKKLRNKLYDTAKPMIEDWIGTPVTPTSLYGIRVYTEGSILAPHVDRMPLVSSVVLNVAQDVDEAWPLELYGHDGVAYNVTMEPGDMLLYEGHSIIHGRPFPLKGRYYANIFIHFEPSGHSHRHSANLHDQTTAKDLFLQAKNNKPNTHHNQPDLPAYILPNSPQETRWRQLHPEQKVRIRTDISSEKSTSNAHIAAANGDVATLKRIAATDPKDLHSIDENGWMPIHEAARGGKVKAVEFLIRQKADVNARTNRGKGGTPLWWAQTKHGEDHEVSKMLRKHGGLAIEPDV